MRRRSKVGNAVFMALVVLLVIAVIAGLVWQKAFVVRNIVIHSADNISQDEIIRAAKVELGGHISDVDADALRVNLQSEGVYALENVETKYPNTLVLSVRRRTRDAVVRNGGKYLVMDSDGYVIEANEAMPEDGGVYVYGLNASSYRIGSRISAPEEKLQAMKAVLDAVRSQNAGGYISDMTVSDTKNIILTTRTGIYVKLGDALNMESKLAWMCSAVSDLENRGSTGGTLDVSSGTKADYMP